MEINAFVISYNSKLLKCFSPTKKMRHYFYLTDVWDILANSFYLMKKADCLKTE